MEEVVEAYDRLIDKAINATADRDGADEEVMLSETLIAVRAAQAVEALTGVDWHQHLESRAEGVEASDEAFSPSTSTET